MQFEIADQNSVSGYEDSERLQEYQVSVLEDASELTALFFKLPHTPDRFSSEPFICLYSDGGLTGYFFDGESHYEELVSGIEQPSGAWENGEYRGFEIAPFLGRENNIDEGFRSYNVPINSSYEFQVTADINSEERDNERLLVEASRDNKMISQLVLGRTTDGWDFMDQKLSENAEM